MRPATAAPKSLSNPSPCLIARPNEMALAWREHLNLNLGRCLAPSLAPTDERIVLLPTSAIGRVRK
jgi:hypothetical protein